MCSEAPELALQVLDSGQLEQITVEDCNDMVDPNFDLKIPTYFSNKNLDLCFPLAAIYRVIKMSKLRNSLAG